MARIVEDLGASMPVQPFEKTLERRSVVEILARMQLEAEIDVCRIRLVEDRPPPSCELFKGALDQARRRGREWIEKRPSEAARERHHASHPETAGKCDRVPQILLRPHLAPCRVASNISGSKSVHHVVVGRMNG